MLRVADTFCLWFDVGVGFGFLTLGDSVFAPVLQPLDGVRYLLGRAANGAGVLLGGRVRGSTTLSRRHLPPGLGHSATELVHLRCGQSVCVV